MGQLNIKDEVLIAEAKELAALLGTSATGAVRVAVQERLARERAGQGGERRRTARRMLAIAAEAAPLVPIGVSSDHRDLFDEHGGAR